MNLLSEAEVLERLGLQESEKNTAAIASALKSVSSHFESVFQTKLDSGEHVNVFHVNSDMVYPIGTLYRLRLKNGFVTDGSVLAYVGDTATEVVQSTATPVTPLSIDLEKGFVFLSADDVEDKFVRVEYSAGFTDEADETIPEWLKDAALHYLVKMLAVSQSEELKTETKNLLELSSQHSTEVLDSHIRNIPMAVSPLY